MSTKFSSVNLSNKHITKRNLTFQFLGITKHAVNSFKHRFRWNSFPLICQPNASSKEPSIPFPTPSYSAKIHKTKEPLGLSEQCYIKIKQVWKKHDTVTENVWDKSKSIKNIKWFMRIHHLLTKDVSLDLKIIRFGQIWTIFFFIDTSCSWRKHIKIWRKQSTYKPICKFFLSFVVFSHFINIQLHFQYSQTCITSVLYIFSWVKQSISITLIMDTYIQQWNCEKIDIIGFFFFWSNL